MEINKTNLICMLLLAFLVGGFLMNIYDSKDCYIKIKQIAKERLIGGLWMTDGNSEIIILDIKNKTYDEIFEIFKHELGHSIYLKNTEEYDSEEAEILANFCEDNFNECLTLL